MAQSTTRSKCKDLTLFGGDEGWNSGDWVASDDSVRGGNSESYLEVNCDNGTARFYGTLDYETLGGAGFASQRTTGDDSKWNLSEYAGIQLKIAKGDKKRYTFIVKDDLLPPNEINGREQATISWECDFELPPQDKPGETCDQTVFIPWEAFNPTYRGKVKKDADPLDTKKIKRFSIMQRSFFGSQEGDFSLTFESINAVCKPPPPGDDTLTFNSKPNALDLRQLESGAAAAERDRDYYSFEGQLPWGICGVNIKMHRQMTHGFIAAGLLVVAYRYFCC